MSFVSLNFKERQNFSISSKTYLFEQKFERQNFSISSKTYLFEHQIKVDLYIPC